MSLFHNGSASNPFALLICNSLKYVSYKQCKAVAADVKAIYGAPTEAEAECHLELFAEKWDQQYPTISKSCGRSGCM